MNTITKSLMPILCVAILHGPAVGVEDGNGEVRISGEMKQWHKVTLTLDGPASAEDATPNPFLDYRMIVTFSHPDSGLTYAVPGYFAADGDAANTGSVSGNKWRAHLSPDRTGTWKYSISFRTGTEVAVSSSAAAGTAVAPSDGATGSFCVAPTDKSGRDLRGKGRLAYVGKHYLQFAGSGQYFLKQGADSPENFLAYEEFDGDFKTDGQKDHFVKDWAPHEKDWKPGDPTWADGRGKDIIGAVNYLASEGLNAFSFLTLNIGGDDRNVFPYTDYKERWRMDCSKLDQWEMVFEHADRLGMYLHFKTQETENETLLDDGDTGPQRRLYYRELVARFSHHLALNWNLGEENGSWGNSGKHRKKKFQTTEQRQAMAEWFHENDPYHHHIVIHNGQRPDDLLGNWSKLTGFSLQTNSPDFRNVPSRIAEYVHKSADAGKPWVVTCDEPGDASYAIRPDNDAQNSHEDGRRNAIWGTLMNQGAGCEYYFGYKAAHSDLTCTDFRSRDKWWDYCRYALEFFEHNSIPFWQMTANHSLTSNEDDYCLAKVGQVYVVYLKPGGTTSLDLSGQSGTFRVDWYNPRSGGNLHTGSVAVVNGGEAVALGNAPSSALEDWVVFVRRSDHDSK